MKRFVFMIIALSLLLISGCAAPRRQSGGNRQNGDKELPKEIRSTEISYFYCKFSTTDRSLADTPIAGQVFTLAADKEGVSCKIRNRSNETASESFPPDEGFFSRLQEVVSRYGLAEKNGMYRKVSGLPPDKGIELEIRYESGERILIFDNQKCFLSNEALEELSALFQPQT